VGFLKGKEKKKKKPTRRFLGRNKIRGELPPYSI
jgi:hypothetical protein